ncbi:GNAT family N-acetyltransferase [Halomonas faecis]|uniref:GNAT family N-acetyltransferase n=1 Tax=Halomonas faecis TaxID=1562110 RepID=UPI0013D86BA0|nr:GNAT family N-acetyltransferase [Halomonas faecis]
MNLDVTDSCEHYRAHCEAEPSIPLFSQSWWLDAVAPGAWSAVLAYRGAEIVGTLPYVKRRKWGMTLLTQPKLTQTLGPWVKSTNKAYPKALAYEKDVLETLACGLPRHQYYAQNWHHCQKNWLPFYWLGFQQTTRYTYRLCGLDNEDALWKGLQQNIRGDIRKAKTRFMINVRPANNLDEFLTLNRATFQRQGRKLPYSKSLVARIDEMVSQRDAGDCLVAVDSDGKLHAGAYIVRSGDTAYYLMGGGDPDLRNSGATSLVLWEAICSQPESVKYFDFEGSMVEPIERFFRAFGARQTPYHLVTKTSSRLLEFALFARDLLGQKKQ